MYLSVTLFSSAVAAMANFDPDYVRQSPININEVDTNFDAAHTVHHDQGWSLDVGIVKDYWTNGESLKFDLEPRPVANSESHHGHTYQGGERQDLHFTSSLTEKWYPDVDFEFTPAQLHFHRGMDHHHASNEGSEDTLNGNHYGLEVHFVMNNNDATTQDKFLAAVLAVLFEEDPTKTEDDHMDKFLNALTDGHYGALDVQRNFVDHLEQYHNNILDHRYNYRGSMTTPDYNEYIFWTMLATPVKIRSATMDGFAQHICGLTGASEECPAVGEANRDVQPTNDREIYDVEISDHYSEEYNAQPAFTMGSIFRAASIMRSFGI